MSGFLESPYAGKYAENSSAHVLATMVDTWLSSPSQPISDSNPITGWSEIQDDGSVSRMLLTTLRGRYKIIVRRED